MRVYTFVKTLKWLGEKVVIGPGGGGGGGGHTDTDGRQCGLLACLIETKV